jgi:hypothetical protein
MRLKSTGIGSNLSALVLPLIARGSESRSPQAGLEPRHPADENAVGSAHTVADSSGGIRPQLSRTFPGAAPVSTSVHTLTAESSGGAAGKRRAKPEMNPVHRAWRVLDQHYMKPLFGGRPDRDTRSEDETLIIRGSSGGGRVPPADTSVNGGVRTSPGRNSIGSLPPALLSVNMDSPPPARPP